jgi:lambda family phage minor tail protein L
MTSVNATTSGNDLVGATVKRIRVLKKHLDGESAADPYASFPTEIFLIDRKATETLQTVTYELASEFDMIGQAIPRRQLLSNVCQWEYRSTECGYSGSNYWDVDDNAVGTLAADRCGKRISSCKLRFGGTNGNDPLPFGSFPGIGLQ